MYGLINMAIKQLVIDQHGELGWEKVLEKSGVKEKNFEMLTVYDDSITYNLVGGACAVTGKPASDILHAFGVYWIQYAAKAGYEPLLKLFGPTMKECLYNLNRMHDHMGAMMPGLIPPEFHIHEEKGPQDYILAYGSQRQGLSPMVGGLLIGLGQRYGVKDMKVEYIGKSADQKSELFHIQWN